MKTEQNAFTLPEILITISIITIIATTALIGYDRVTKNARDTERRVNVNEISTALEKYNNEEGRYPLTLERLITPPAFIEIVPNDPLSGDPYTYETNDDRSAYSVTAQLELTDRFYIATPAGEHTGTSGITLAPTERPFPSLIMPSTIPTPAISITNTPTPVQPTWIYE